MDRYNPFQLSWACSWLQTSDLFFPCFLSGERPLFLRQRWGLLEDIVLSLKITSTNRGFLSRILLPLILFQVSRQSSGTGSTHPSNNLPSLRNSSCLMFSVGTLLWLNKLIAFSCHSLTSCSHWDSSFTREEDPHIFVLRLEDPLPEINDRGKHSFSFTENGQVCGTSVYVCHLGYLVSVGS